MELEPDPYERERRAGEAALVALYGTTLSAILLLPVLLSGSLTMAVLDIVGYGQRRASAAGIAVSLLAGAAAWMYVLAKTRGIKPAARPRRPGDRYEGLQAKSRLLFTERTLEAAFAATALGVLAWTSLNGMGSAGARVALIVVEGFSVVFLGVFSVAWWRSSGNPPAGALAVMALSFVSLLKLVSRFKLN